MIVPFFKPLLSIKKSIPDKVFSFLKAYKFFLFLFFFIFPNFVLAHNHHSHNEEEIDMALQLFEKAYQLSPDLLPQENSLNSLISYYNHKGEKIFLTQSSIVLMREWVHIFANEIERHCENCHIDKEALLEEAVKNELLIKEAEDYVPENRLVKATSDKAKHSIEGLSHLSVNLTAKYGKTIAGLIGIVEVFETVASFVMGLKGMHFICTPLQILIIPAGRKVQRYGRTLFFYGFNLSNTSLLLTSKMAWTTRVLHKRAKNTFFYIDQALEFNEEELQKTNLEGPKSIYYRKGHRLVWLENLKKKTDPLFAEIENIKKELEQNNYESLKKASDELVVERQKLKTIETFKRGKKYNMEKRIRNIRNKIEKLTKINRKEFFGNRFKRYLFLKSRKGRRAYMDGPDLKSFDFIHKTIGSRSISWPLAPQFMMKQILEPEAYRKDTLLGDRKTPLHKNSDEVISGLIEEFLSGQNRLDELDQRQKTVHFFISDFHNLFDTTQTSASKVMSAQAIEVLLTQFFAHYLELAEKEISNLHSMGFRNRRRVNKRIGKIQNLAMQFTDFLTAVAFATNPNKINFYKYETIEKFFAFLNYFDQIGQIIKQNLTAEETLAQMDQAQKKVESFSLTREKNSRINFIPFKKRKGKCYEITRKY